MKQRALLFALLLGAVGLACWLFVASDSGSSALAGTEGTPAPRPPQNSASDDRASTTHSDREAVQLETSGSPASTTSAPDPDERALDIADQRERFRSILKQRLVDRPSSDLSEAERWLERYCLLELIELDYLDSAPEDRLQHAHTLLTYCIATSLDLSGRWFTGASKPPAKPGFVRMQVNNRHYVFATDEFPLYDEYGKLPSLTKDMTAAERAHHEHQLADSILQLAQEEKRTARQFFSPTWIQ